MGSFYIRIPNDYGTHINIKTHIFPINVPFLIGIEVFLEYSLPLDLETHQLMCKKEKEWEIPPQYLSGHVYIKPHQE